VKLYWDASAFITMVENGGVLSERLGTLLEFAIDEEISIVTNELTLAELLVRPLREANEDRVYVYRDLIKAAGGIDVRSVSRDILLMTAQIRADHPTIKLPDAVHVATAETSGCEDFLSGDLRLPVRPSYQRIHLDLLSLDELIARSRG
jgi:predicted nucleic acid-binding protein